MALSFVSDILAVALFRPGENTQKEKAMFYKSALVLAFGFSFLTARAEPGKVGVLFSSFGDVDDVSEVEPFVKNTLRDPDVVPVPDWMRPIISDLGWHVTKKDVLAEYAALGGRTNFRKNSQIQADAVAAKLMERGYYARGYSGFTMTFPDISESLLKAKEDGVNELVVFYQGAQWSKPTAQIVQRETISFLKAHPDWNAKVTMVRSFSDDARFQELMVQDVASRIAEQFPAAAPTEVCIVLPAHGNPVKLNKEGDPAYNQMMRVVAAVRNALPQYKIFHGFQNHSEIPTLKWTQPDLDNVAKDVAKADCKYVLVNGRISFTVDSLETLFDHAISFAGDVRSLNPGKTIFVEKMFNDDERFVELMSDLAQEAMSGSGDINKLR